MILIDANLLVYAHVASMPQHQTAVSWLDRKLNGNRYRGVALAKPSEFCPAGHQFAALPTTVTRYEGLGTNRTLA